MQTEYQSRFTPTLWLPDSLRTKFSDGFRRDSRIDDGSELTIELIDELASLQGPMIDKLYALYASGVTDHEGQVFSPKQILSMIAHRNQYKPEDICRWTGGIRTETGIVYGPDASKKEMLLESLCNVLDRWQPKDFKQAPFINLRERLDGDIKNGISDHELAVYLVANYAQFVFLVIHPFWNRNGRTSEELMHLFCAQNQARRLVFWGKDGTRYTEATDTRMRLINRSAQELLASVLANLDVATEPDKAVTEGYKNFFLSGQPSPATRLALSVMTPYHYRFLSDMLSPQHSVKYFNAMGGKIDKMVNMLQPESTSELVQDNLPCALLQHQLEYGRFEMNECESSGTT